MNDEAMAHWGASGSKTNILIYLEKNVRAFSHFAVI